MQLAPGIAASRQVGHNVSQQKPELECLTRNARNAQVGVYDLIAIIGMQATDHGHVCHGCCDRRKRNV
jgi:hypothetical protein